MLGMEPVNWATLIPLLCFKFILTHFLYMKNSLEMFSCKKKFVIFTK